MSSWINEIMIILSLFVLQHYLVDFHTILAVLCGSQGYLLSH